MSEERNSQARLLGLPAELPNHIYGLLFGCGDCEWYNPVLEFRGLQQCKCTGLSVMRVCRQTRSETFKLFYRNHDVRFILNRLNKTVIHSSIDMIGPEAIANIQHFHFRAYYYLDIIYRHTPSR